MQDESLLRRARRLRRRADQIIRGSDVVRLFSSLGRATFVGSYSLDLMYRPDIDLIVLSDSPARNKAVGVTIQLLESGYFQTVGFADWFSHRRRGVPRGFYWELVAPVRGVDWKLDVWYLAPREDRSVGRTEKYAGLLQSDPSASEAILKIKSELFDGTKYRGGIEGFEICAAVLEQGMTTAAELEQCTSTHGPGYRAEPGSGLL